MTTPNPRVWRWALLIGTGALALAATGCARRAYRTGTVAVYSAPPPPPQQQVVVQRPAQPYANSVWVEGHWEWNGGQYVWTPGYYVQARAGYQFQQPRWVRRGNQHVYVQGGWARQGRVVHTVRPAPRRSNIYVRPGRRRGVRVRTNVRPRRNVVVQRRGPGRVVVQGNRGRVTVQRQRPVRRRTVQRRRGGVRVQARTPGRGRGPSVTVRPR